MNRSHYKWYVLRIELISNQWCVRNLIVLNSYHNIFPFICEALISSVVIVYIFLSTNLSPSNTISDSIYKGTSFKMLVLLEKFIRNRSVKFPNEVYYIKKINLLFNFVSLVSNNNNNNILSNKAQTKVINLKSQFSAWNVLSCGHG